MVDQTIHFQDNLSKAPLAQQYQDHEGEAAERLRNIAREGAVKQQEEVEKHTAEGMEEKTNSKGIDRDGRRRQEKSRKGAKLPMKKEDGSILEAENDLRMRRPEDDAGKGDKLDIEV